MTKAISFTSQKTRMDLSFNFIVEGLNVHQQPVCSYKGYVLKIMHCVIIYIPLVSQTYMKIA